MELLNVSEFCVCLQSKHRALEQVEKPALGRGLSSRVLTTRSLIFLGRLKDTIGGSLNSFANLGLSKSLGMWKVKILCRSFREGWYVVTIGTLQLLDFSLYCRSDDLSMFFTSLIALSTDCGL